MNLHFLNLKDLRKTNDPQLWICGCSFAHGVGVFRNQTFGSLLSTKLQLPVSYLTQPGTSISWAADQILRSDIRKNDIVIWGITGASRLTFLDDKNILHHVGVSNFDTTVQIKDYFNKKLLVSRHMLYESFTHISQVVNFLNKIGATFVLAILPLNCEEHDLETNKFTENFEETLIMNDSEFIDFGHDNLHPGPLQHSWYAEQIYNKYLSLK